MLGLGIHHLLFRGGAEVESNKQRRGLKKLLSLAITLGMLHDSLSAEVAEGRRRAEQT